MEITFAPAVELDIERLCALNKELIDAYEDLSTIDYDQVLAWVRRKVTGRLNEYNCIFYDGLKAGYYRRCLRDGKVELDDLYVFPQFQGRGIGTQVLKNCLIETDSPIFFYVFTKNTRAIALYQRLGFQIIEVVGNSRYIMQRDTDCHSSLRTASQ